jgi:ABC-type antimicrobial peptide transport system permease subunit
VNMVNRPQRVEIVGVVGSLNQLGLDAPSQPEIVMPYTQRASDAMAIVLRATSGVQPTALAAAAREELRHLDVDLPITDVKTMDEWIRRGTSQSRFVLVLVTLFGLVATVLAACGIFGVVAHSVSRRTQEIAIRLALGARPTGVVARIAGQHLWCVLAGVAVGIVGALGATRLLTAYLFGVQRTDTTTYAAAAVLLFLVALTAAVVPAARAARIQPAIILKAE